jgi:hypothetical protein
MDDGCIALSNSYAPSNWDMLQQIAQYSLGLLFGFRMADDVSMVKNWNHLFFLALAHETFLRDVAAGTPEEPV